MKDEINEIDGKWVFDEKVTNVFSDMLSRSIPLYEDMRKLCYMVGRNFLKGGAVVDLGCSNGLATETFIKNHKDEKFVLCDISEPMLEACKKRYAEEIASDRVLVVKNDLRDGINCHTTVDLFLSILTIQFTPIEYRQDIIQEVYDSLRKGGAFIFVEKVLGNSAEINNILVKEYYELKKENEYTEEQIRNKRRSLEGVLVPLTSQFNESLLKTAGFKRIDCFWRSLNFVGWVAVK